MKYSRTSAARPAAAGDDMLVPLSVRVLQLSDVTVPSLLAELMLLPGTMTSGLKRLSSVRPQLLKPDLDSASVPRRVEPTETTLLAVEGLITDPGSDPALPAAKSSRKSGWFH